MIMPLVKIFETSPGSSEKGNVFDLSAESSIVCSHIMLSAREKNGSFLEIKNGTISEKFECKIIIKVWSELESQFRFLRFGGYYFESDNFHGIISFPAGTPINPDKVIPKAVSEFKSHTTLLLNRYHNLQHRVFWENSYREVNFVDNGTLGNLMDYFWKHPA